jgi:aspartate carbamoyltransferase catalytic subunit
MQGKDLVSIKELSREDLETFLRVASKMKEEPAPPLLKGKLMASCFFEPSTRTRLSFEAAMRRLGGEVIGFSEGETTSQQKGELLSDAMKIVGMYADCIVIRHPLEGSARCAAEATDKPVINAGDGANEHPTQTLLDLFTIQECQGQLDGLHIALAGDLLHGRTVHSLVYALRHFRVRLYFVSCPTLAFPDKVIRELKTFGIPFSYHASLEEIIDRLDILYMTRLQKERLSHAYSTPLHTVTAELLEKGKKTLKILHPLPRLGEIARAIDQMPQAHYFQQASNGLFMRQAILTLLLGGS